MVVIHVVDGRKIPSAYRNCSGEAPDCLLNIEKPPWLPYVTAVPGLIVAAQQKAFFNITKLFSFHFFKLIFELILERHVLSLNRCHTAKRTVSVTYFV